MQTLAAQQYATLHTPVSAAARPLNKSYVSYPPQSLRAVPTSVASSRSIFQSGTNHSSFRRHLHDVTVHHSSRNGTGRITGSLPAVERWWKKFSKQLKHELGLDTEEASRLSGELVEDAATLAGTLRETAKLNLPQTVDGVKGKLREFKEWNSPQHWKDVRNWGVNRWICVLLALALGGMAARGSYRLAVAAPKKVEAAAETWMDIAVPDPTPQNLQRLKRAVWRRSKPEGYKESRLVQGEDGAWYRDMEYEGETAWQDKPAEAVEERVPSGGSPAQERLPWKERLAEWDAMLKIEEWKEAVGEARSRKVPHSDLARMKAEALQNSNAGDKRALIGGENSAGFWVAKWWWKYRPTMPYTWLLGAVERGELSKAVYTEDLRQLYVTTRQGFPSEYRIQVPIDPFLYESLVQQGVQLGHLPRHPLSFLRAMAVITPSLIILSTIIAAQYALREQLDERLDDLVRMDRSQLIQPGDEEDVARTGYGDVVMGPEVWQVLEEVLTYMKNPMQYYGKRVKLPRGILISGPPGTGKTLLARAIAREAGLPFVFASGAEFADTSGGGGMDKVFETFFTARANAPSFVFIDEIDALAGKNVVESEERMAVFRQLLAELDGAPEDTDVDRFAPRQAWILIAATNRPEDLHEDLMQPGRIDREIHIGLPAEAERIQIFDVHSRGRALGADVDFSQLAFRTLGFCGADVRNLVNESAILAARDGRKEMTQNDVRMALDKQLFEGLGLSLTPEEEQEAFRSVPSELRRILAVHEAGHILIAHLLPSFDYHAFTHILPGGQESALSVFYPRQEMVETGESSTGYVRMQMMMAHGGRCAEKIVFGEEQITDGGVDDLIKISRMARELTVSSTNPRLGLIPLTFHPLLATPEVPGEPNLIPNMWNQPGSARANMSPPLAETFTREITRYVDETEAAAMEALTKNRSILDRLADELYARFKLSGVDAERLIHSMSPVMMKDPMGPPPSNVMEVPDLLSLDPNKPGGYEYLDIYPAPLHRC